MADEQNKIIVDSDWKSEAQAEKARLDEQEKARAAKVKGIGGPGGGDKAGGGGGGGPSASFDELVRMFALPALMYMGQMPDPQTGKAVVALDIAKLHIDLLSVVEEKTAGNLSDEESKMLSTTVSELRMAFVEVTKAVEQAVAEGKISAQGAEGMMGGGGVGGAGGGAGGISGPGM